MSRRGAILQDYGGAFPEQSTQAQRDAAQYYQRDKEQANQMQQQKQAAKGKEQGDAIDYINKLDVPDIGDTTIDLYNDAQLKAVQDELMGMASKGTGVNEIKMAALPKLQKIGQGYTIAKNEYNKITNGVKELSKDYPTGDMEAARNVAGKNMIETIFEFNDDGTVKGYKDPSLIPPDKNYLGELTTNQNLPKWYKKSGEFESGIKKLPLIPIKGGTTRTDKFGRKVKQTYTGHGSIFDEPIMNDEGEQTGWRLKSEAVPLGRNEDGSLIIEQVMPKEQFEMALSTPAAKLDFQYDFNKNLEQKGINPDSLDPRARDVLERKFAYDLFSNTGIHGSSFLTTDEIKEAPVKNITNNNINTGGKNDDTKINNLYGRIGGKIDANIEKGFTATRFSSLENDEQALIKQTVENAGYPLEEGGANIYLAKDGSEYKIYKTVPKEKLSPQNKDNEIATLSFIGINLPKQANVQAKKEVVKQGEQNRSNPKPTVGKIPVGTILTGKDGKKIKTTREITQAEAAAAGYKQ